MKKPLVHVCIYNSYRVGDFRDKHVMGDKVRYGSGLTVWEHMCKECGTTLYSTSQWQYPPDTGGVNEESLSRCKVRTPQRKAEDVWATCLATREKPVPTRTAPTKRNHKPFTRGNRNAS